MQWWVVSDVELRVEVICCSVDSSLMASCVGLDVASAVLFVGTSSSPVPVLNLGLRPFLIRSYISSKYGLHCTSSCLASRSLDLFVFFGLVFVLLASSCAFSFSASLSLHIRLLALLAPPISVATSPLLGLANRCIAVSTAVVILVEVSGVVFTLSCFCRRLSALMVCCSSVTGVVSACLISG
jgi:hypothetical protein